MRRRELILLAALAGSACADKPDPRFTVHGDEVSDASTNLAWQRNPSPTSMPLADAKAYCEQAGMRLPTIDELLGITRKVRVWQALRGKPAIDVHAFPGTPTSNFWALANDGQLPRSPGDKVYVVDFSDGTHHSLAVAGDGFRVRCVR